MIKRKVPLVVSVNQKYNISKIIIEILHQICIVGQTPELQN